ncbi:MAG TPA: ATP-binding cassette domain-containing protein [Virgibacillus sp.]|nr:ATP-binding cassette domain-containing protein [Virgibacillus sp.]
MIKISQLKKSYGDNLVLDQLTKSFTNRGIDIIIGVNGSGKTTLLNCICDITPFETGMITINDIDRKEKEAKENMYYIPSEFYLPDYLTGHEYARFVFSRYEQSDEKTFDFLIDLYHLTSAIHHKISDYSYGMKKKLQLSIAFSLNAQYILADEVFNGLDYESYLLTDYLFNVFSAHRKFILITHNMDYITRNPQANVYLLHAGSLQLMKDVHKIEEIVINQGELKDAYEKIDRFPFNFKTIAE